MENFWKVYKTKKTSAAITQKKAEEFIVQHPHSFVSAYLINDYFVQVPQPDIEKDQSLIEPLGGNIKDSRILSMALKVNTS